MAFSSPSRIFEIPVYTKLFSASNKAFFSPDIWNPVKLCFKFLFGCFHGRNPFHTIDCAIKLFCDMLLRNMPKVSHHFAHTTRGGLSTFLPNGFGGLCFGHKVHSKGSSGRHYQNAHNPASNACLISQIGAAFVIYACTIYLFSSFSRCFVLNVQYGQCLIFNMFNV